MLTQKGRLQGTAWGHGYCASPARPIWFYLDGGAQEVLMRIHRLALAEAVVRTSAVIKSHQGTPIFTHPLHHAANATLFPAKSAQEPIESPVFLYSEQFPQ